MCSLTFASLLALGGGWIGSAIPAFLWATVVSGILGVMSWRMLLRDIAPPSLMRIIEPPGSRPAK